jgi:hypothetical protein
MGHTRSEGRRVCAFYIVGVVLTVVCLGASVCNVFAAEFSIKGNVSETLQGSNNEFLVNSPSGAAGETTTAGTLNFLAQTPTTSYLLNANLSYYKYFGPGTTDTSLTWGTPASTTFTINHVTMLSRFIVGASWSRADVATTQLAQSGFSTGQGTFDTYKAFGSVAHDFSRLDTVTLSANASTVSYSDPTQTPYTDISSTINWAHTLTPLTTLTNSILFDVYSEDNIEQSQRLFWQFNSGFQSKLTPRLTLNGNVDLVFANTYDRAAVAGPPSPPGGMPFLPQVGAGHAVFGNLGLSYRLTQTTTASLTVADTVFPTLTGQLQQSETIGASLNHQINELESISFFAQLAKTQTPGQIGQSSATSSDFLTANVVYSRQLTRQWRSSISYSYLQREDDTGTARSNMILFTLSRDFNILGNPAAINEAEEARARERAQQAVGEVFPLYH